MTKLLKRWAELEPKRCTIDRDGRTVYLFNDSWRVDMEETRHLVQLAVQDAIEKKQWDWYVEWINREISFEAHVHGKSSHSYRNSAEALLSAYLQALESQEVPT